MSPGRKSHRIPIRNVLHIHENVPKGTVCLLWKYATSILKSACQTARAILWKLRKLKCAARLLFYFSKEMMYSQIKESRPLRTFSCICKTFFHRYTLLFKPVSNGLVSLLGTWLHKCPLIVNGHRNFPYGIDDGTAVVTFRKKKSTGALEHRLRRCICGCGHIFQGSYYHEQWIYKG